MEAGREWGLGAKSFYKLPKITWHGDEWDHKISEQQNLLKAKVDVTICEESYVEFGGGFF